MGRRMSLGAALLGFACYHCYMDAFMLLARSVVDAIWQHDYIQRHFHGFGLLRNPTKGV